MFIGLLRIGKPIKEAGMRVGATHRHCRRVVAEGRCVHRIPRAFLRGRMVQAARQTTAEPQVLLMLYPSNFCYCCSPPAPREAYPHKGGRGRVGRLGKQGGARRGRGVYIHL